MAGPHAELRTSVRRDMLCADTAGSNTSHGTAHTRSSGVQWGRVARIHTNYTVGPGASRSMRAAMVHLNIQVVNVSVRRAIGNGSSVFLADARAQGRATMASRPRVSSPEPRRTRYVAAVMSNEVMAGLPSIIA